jgi:DMSO/TMAO reductase YedYZ molybdopterin-dependent catalytic subunit
MKKYLLILIILLVGCEAYVSSQDVVPLDSVEIREYKGKDLSSVNDFRENSIKGPQYIDLDNYELKISGLVEEEKTYTYEEVLAHQSYSKVVTLYCVEGWDATILWEGVLVKDLIGDINPEANTIIFSAYDGYTTALPLDYILDNDILLAYKMNNITMPPERGYPFELVAEDKAGYKWIKWVTEIELSNDENYLGYWEKRGWDNDANLE